MDSAMKKMISNTKLLSEIDSRSNFHIFMDDENDLNYL